MNLPLILLATLAASTTASCPPIHVDFPLLNGGFERNLAHWTLQTTSPDWTATTVSPGHSTPHALLTRNNVSSTSPDFNVRLSQAFATCPGRNYTFSAFYRLPNNNVLYPRFSIEVQPGSVHVADSTIGRWLQMTGTFVARGGKSVIALGTTARNGVNDGDFLVDSVVVGATRGV